MSRKTLKSLEAQIAELRELNEHKNRREQAIMDELSDTKQRFKEAIDRYNQLRIEYDWVKRLCSELSQAVRTRS